MGSVAVAALQRFQVKVNQDGPTHPYDPQAGVCWLWTAATNEHGYGVFGDRGQHTVLAHRYAYSQHHGLEVVGLVVRHTCDRPACVNPSHLLSGTQAQNVADAVARGRTRGSSRPGSSNPSALLDQGTVDSIRELRAQGWSLDRLTAHFTISRSQMHRIITGQSWPTTRGDKHG